MESIKHLTKKALKFYPRFLGKLLDCLDLILEKILSF